MIIIIIIIIIMRVVPSFELHLLIRESDRLIEKRNDCLWQIILFKFGSSIIENF